TKKGNSHNFPGRNVLLHPSHRFSPVDGSSSPAFGIKYAESHVGCLRNRCFICRARCRWFAAVRRIPDDKTRELDISMQLSATRDNAGRGYAVLIAAGIMVDPRQFPLGQGVQEYRPVMPIGGVFCRPVSPFRPRWCRCPSPLSKPEEFGEKQVFHQLGGGDLLGPERCLQADDIFTAGSGKPFEAGET